MNSYILDVIVLVNSYILDVIVLVNSYILDVIVLVNSYILDVIVNKALCIVRRHLSFIFNISPFFYSD